MSFFPTLAGTVRADDLPREVLGLAEALSRRHGEVVVTKEENGLHLYMASPEALVRDGWVELSKRHLAVNAEKYLRRGVRKRRSKEAYSQQDTRAVPGPSRQCTRFPGRSGKLCVRLLVELSAEAEAILTVASTHRSL